MKYQKYVDHLPMTSCDVNGDWIDIVEENYENEFFKILHRCSSVEEFIIQCDLNDSQFDLDYLDFESKDELLQFVKDYYELQQKVNI